MLDAVNLVLYVRQSVKGASNSKAIAFGGKVVHLHQYQAHRLQDHMVLSWPQPFDRLILKPSGVPLPPEHQLSLLAFQMSTLML